MTYKPKIRGKKEERKKKEKQLKDFKRQQLLKQIPHQYY